MTPPLANAILSQLPEAELAELGTYLQLVHLRKGQLLHGPGQHIAHYYFPITSTVELAIDLEDGKGGATAVINMSSLYPLHLLSEMHSQQRATVRKAGLCYRIPAVAVHRLLRHSPRLLWILLQESVRLFEQAGQESVCMRNHSVEQITAKLILQSLDDGHGNTLELTHQEIANALGTRREGVSLTLQKFRTQQLLHSERGRIQVLDRAGLERVACGCYQTLRQARQSPLRLAKSFTP